MQILPIQKLFRLLPLVYTGLAVNFVVFCSTDLFVLLDGHGLFLYRVLLYIMLSIVQVKCMYTACNRLRLSTDIKVLLTYLIT